MAKSKKGRVKTPNLTATPDAAPCCRIEALVSLDARGQILLPKEVRKRAGLRTGDKLALISCESEGAISRITLVKAEQFMETAREMLGPMVDMLRE